MNLMEIGWRLKQKIISNNERKKYYFLHLPVTKIPLPKKISDLKIDINKLTINWSNNNWAEFSFLDLFDLFDYEKYKTQWNAGFQTENTWPENPYSPTIPISQRIDIGDIRTNWELNRHFQFTALAKSYYCTGKKKFLDEFKTLFFDWNQHNLFLHGVEWTSAMEIAIRVNSWIYSYAFLKKSGCKESFLNDIEHGILVMTDYITKHRARFSSANNHLIIEMYAIALVGILTNHVNWRNEALRILTEELPKQNYPDGVNKEMSLHYQSFVMEAYGLLWLLMVKNGIELPSVWKTYLTAMSEFVADSTDDFGTTIEFGDCDEGKILDLRGTLENYYSYVLNLMGYILDKTYTDAPWHENLEWIIPETSKTEKERYIPRLVCSRKEGGYTFLRSKDRRVLIGIDHANLGFGNIAAHGHADALSFQMSIDGQLIFVDSGTFNYHVTPEDRNDFRSTAAHNTVMINGQEQSEMLGPFIWGKRAKAELEIVNIQIDKIIIKTKYNGPCGNLTREFEFNYLNSIKIYDDVDKHDGRIFLHIDPHYNMKLENGNNCISIQGKDIIISGNSWRKEFHGFSSKYNQKTKAPVACMNFKGSNTIRIQW